MKIAFVTVKAGQGPCLNTGRQQSVLYLLYCAYARGPSRSRDPRKVLSEAEQLLAAGYKEIVLTGIHIGAYGKDLEDKIDLAELLARLLELDGMKRLRLGSIEPMEFTADLLHIITTRPEICPHFHIPLQSGSNAILEK
jgi:threonylcarbamoyladenosine tRNA methylthiotransferase MtaB